MKVTETDVKNVQKHIPSMRNWLIECDMDENTVEELTELEVVRLVHRNFHGGINEFVSIEENPVYLHIYNNQGFCKYCHNTHRTDMNKSEVCTGQK
jgi:hypothetical protein